MDHVGPRFCSLPRLALAGSLAGNRAEAFQTHKANDFSDGNRQCRQQGGGHQQENYDPNYRNAQVQGGLIPTGQPVEHLPGHLSHHGSE